MWMSSQDKQRTWFEDHSFKEDGILLPSPPLQRSSSQHTLLRSSSFAIGRPPPSFAVSDSQEFSINSGSCSLVSFTESETGEPPNTVMDPPVCTYATDEFVLDELKAFLTSQSINNVLAWSSPSAEFDDVGLFLNDPSQPSYHQPLENLDSMDFHLYDMLDGSDNQSNNAMHEPDSDMPLFPQLSRST